MSVEPWQAKILQTFFDNGSQYISIASVRRSGRSRWLKECAEWDALWDRLYPSPDQQDAPSSEGATP
jgi:hypothetical protein